MKIEFKNPDIIVRKNINAEQYPRFLEKYPDKAISMGLGEPRISIEKKFESQEGIKID